MRIALLALLAALAAAAVARDAWRQLYQPLPIPAGHRVDVPPGRGLGSVLSELERSGLMRARQRLYLSWYARLRGQDRRIQAGEYELGAGMRPVDLTALLVSGRVVLHELRLPEGWRFSDAAAAVRAHAALRQTLPDDGGAALMQALGHPDLHPEGRFYPDTYRFARGTTDVAFLRRAFERMQAVLEEEWAGRAEGLPYRGPDEALVMASIVERETGLPQERAQVAGVFVRRLHKRMRLQTDPTVIYGLGAAFDGNLRKRDLLADTPYNTYTRAGLPPTPICLPGRPALHAALHPAPGETLYFVARGDGSHEFSATLAEHNAAVQKHQLRGRRR
jgi:UPF0755 protein